jgi:ElaB/YqjD/DUF883 family membrane-anchored ribosome-binding protein
MKKRNGTTESPEQLVTHLRDLLAEAEQLVGDSAGEFVGEKSEDMRARLQHAQERLQEFYSTARDKVVAGAKSTDATIRSHPYESLAVALGIGLLIGALMRRGNH